MRMQLLDPETSVVLLRGTAVEDFTRKVNPRLLTKVRTHDPAQLSAETALSMLL